MSHMYCTFMESVPRMLITIRLLSKSTPKTSCGTYLKELCQEIYQIGRM